VKVQIDYINPWIAKKRTLVLEVCTAGDAACTDGQSGGGTTNSPPMLLVPSPQNPWGPPPGPGYGD